MIRLARFESRKGGRDLALRHYSLRGHMLLNLVRTFFLTTVGFICLMMLVVTGNLSYLLDHIVGVDIRAMMMFLVMAYGGLIFFYLAVAVIVSYRSYRRADDHVRRYEKDLRRLDAELRRFDR